MMGAVIERIGPVNSDCVLLLWGAMIVTVSTSITNGTGLIIVRFFVSMLGSTFVVNQFWNSILFNKAVVGTANATAGGWGNLGGGLTWALMPLLYRFFHDAIGLNLAWSRRAAMYVPAAIYLILATWIKTCPQDTTSGKFNVAQLGKTTKAGFRTYVECCTDYRVFLMIFQYSACFGCELVMNNTLATHFHARTLVGTLHVALRPSGLPLPLRLRHLGHGLARRSRSVDHLLVLCQRGRGHVVRDRSVHDPPAFGGGLRCRRRRWDSGCSHRHLGVLQVRGGRFAPLQAARHLRGFLGLDLFPHALGPPG